MHSSNTDHFMFKRLLINKFRVKLIEIFIITICYTVISNIQSRRLTTLERKEKEKKSIAPTSKKALFILGMLQFGIYINIYTLCKHSPTCNAALRVRRPLEVERPPCSTRTGGPFHCHSQHGQSVSPPPPPAWLEDRRFSSDTPGSLQSTQQQASALPPGSGFCFTRTFPHLSVLLNNLA